MGTPAAGRAFLEALICQGEALDLNQAPSFDALTLHRLRDVRASEGRVTCLLRAEGPLTNRYGTLHGGCIATIVDLVGSAALVTQSEKSGVSLSITVAYLSPGRGGEDVFIDAQVVKIGKSIGVIDVSLSAGEGGPVVAQGTHIKFLPGFEKSLVAQRPTELVRRTREQLAPQAKL